MRIHIQSPDCRLLLLLPTGLVFSRGSTWLINRIAGSFAGDTMKHLPPETVNALFAEIRRIKRTYGTWNLVEVSSADGKRVTIRL